MGASRRALHHLLVLFIVLLSSLIVLEGIFDHGDTNDEHERHESGGCAVEILKTGDQLQDRHEEEVHVGHLAELHEQVLGQESEAIVLGRDHFVGHELPVELVLSKHRVDLEDAPRGKLLRF